MSGLRRLIVPGVLLLAAGAATSIVVMNIALGVLLAVIVLAASSEERRRFGAAALPLLPWGAGIVLAWAFAPGLPVGKLGRLFPWVTLPLMAAFAGAVDARRWANWFFAGAAAAAALGIFQHLQGIGVFDTGLCSFGQAAYDGSITKLLCGYKAGTRARGFFFTPMTFGAVFAFAVLAVPSAGAHLALRRRGLLIALFTVALAVSSTRSAWIGLLAGLPFVLGANRRAWLSAGLAALLVAGVVAAAPVLRARVTSLAHVNTDPSTSTGARLFLWRDALAQFAEHPVFGWGPGTFRENVESRHPDVDLLSTRHAHNNYLQSLAETGAVGFAGFLATFGWLALRLRAAPKGLRRLGFAMLATFAVSGLFEASYLDSEVVINLFAWFGLALAARATPTVDEPAPL